MSSPTSRVPLSTHVLLVSVMVMFFTGAVAFSLQAAWQWWLVPEIAAVVAVVLLVPRIGRLRERRAMAELSRQVQAERGRP